MKSLLPRIAKVDWPYKTPICKIAQSNNVFFASSGLAKETSTNFNAETIPAQAASSNSKILDKVNASEKLLLSEHEKQIIITGRNVGRNYTKGTKNLRRVSAYSALCLRILMGLGRRVRRLYICTQVS